MIRYTCDSCHREIDEDEVRYVVRLEVYAAHDPIDPEAIDGDRDHLEEMHEILQRMDDVANEMISDEVYEHKRFDLCAACRKRFLKNPLKMESASELQFSQN